MIKISKNEASKRIFKIAKSVAEFEALNGSLTPMQQKDVRIAVAKILASSEIAEEDLDKISEDLKEEAGFSESSEENEEVKEEKVQTADEEVEEIKKQTEKKFDNQAVRKMNQGAVKQFIAKNKMKKLKALEQFISELPAIIF